MRALYFMNLPEVLTVLHILNSPIQIRLLQLTTTFISAWFTSAGLLHLVQMLILKMNIAFIYLTYDL